MENSIEKLHINVVVKVEMENKEGGIPESGTWRKKNINFYFKYIYIYYKS